MVRSTMGTAEMLAQLPKSGYAGVWGENICGLKLSRHADRGNYQKVGGDGLKV